jgi:hypothetical protein
LFEAPFNYFAFLAILIVFSVASTVLFVLILYRVGLSLAFVISLGIVFAFLIQPTDVQFWWGAALHTLPATLAELGAVCVLEVRPRFHRLVVAVAFYAKLLFVGFILFGIAVFLEMRDNPRLPLIRSAVEAISELRCAIIVGGCFSFSSCELSRHRKHYPQYQSFSNLFGARCSTVPFPRLSDSAPGPRCYSRTMLSRCC